jgi:hypothetical protein
MQSVPGQKLQGREMVQVANSTYGSIRRMQLESLSTPGSSAPADLEEHLLPKLREQYKSMVRQTMQENGSHAGIRTLFMTSSQGSLHSVSGVGNSL